MDIDNDGDLDLLVGEKYENVHYYQRQSDGSLKEQPVLIKVEKPDGNENLAIMSISPSVTDWNGDGKLDILMGADVHKSGKAWPIRVYLNKGTKENPSFDTYDTLKDNTGKVVQGRCARIHVADLNLDKKQDLVLGTQKCSVEYYKNVGTNSKPVLEKHTLCPNADYGLPTKPDFGQNAGFGYATPRIYDYNQDRKPDLLLSGYNVGEILVYLNVASTPIENEKQNLSKTGYELCVRRSSNNLSISYTLKHRADVSLTISDASGKALKSLCNNIMESGHHSIDVNSSLFPCGVYFIQLKTDDFSVSRKLMLVK